jgi:hypothetical protein
MVATTRGGGIIKVMSTPAVYRCTHACNGITATKSPPMTACAIFCNKHKLACTVRACIAT